MQNGISPIHVSTLVPDSLCNINNTQTIRYNTQQYYNSFLPAVVRCWKELLQPNRVSGSLATFKHKLNAKKGCGGGVCVCGGGGGGLLSSMISVKARSSISHQTWKLGTSCSILN